MSKSHESDGKWYKTQFNSIHYTSVVCSRFQLLSFIPWDSSWAFRHILLTPWQSYTYSHWLKATHEENDKKAMAKNWISANTANLTLIMFFGVFSPFLSLTRHIFAIRQSCSSRSMTTTYWDVLCVQAKSREQIKKRNTDFRYSYIINLRRILHICTIFRRRRYYLEHWSRSKVLICIRVTCYELCVILLWCHKCSIISVRSMYLAP